MYSFLSYFTLLSYIGLTAYYWAAAVQTFFYARYGRYPLCRWPRLLQGLHVLLQSTITVFRASLFFTCLFITHSDFLILAHIQPSLLRSYTGRSSPHPKHLPRLLTVSPFYFLGSVAILSISGVSISTSDLLALKPESSDFRRGVLLATSA